MKNLVTLDEAKAHLRIDGNDIDEAVKMAIAGASLAVLRYLKRDEDYPDDGVPGDVRSATLLLIGTFVRDPDGAEAQQWQQGYPPNAVTALLYPLRDPTAA